MGLPSWVAVLNISRSGLTPPGCQGTQALPWATGGTLLQEVERASALGLQLGKRRTGRDKSRMGFWGGGRYKGPKGRVRAAWGHQGAPHLRAWADIRRRDWGGRAHASCVTGRGGRCARGLASWFRSPRRLPCPSAALLGPMYRALYAFRSAEPNALAFAAGETFLVLERSSAHWWLAARARSGETGYVPPAYLRRLQVSVFLPAGPPRTPVQVCRTDPRPTGTSSR